MGCYGSKNSTSNPSKSMVSITAGVKQLKQIYQINPKVLGAGSFGKVFLAENKQNPEHRVAIKVIQKTKLQPAEIKAIRQEVAILQTLDHPNIVKYYETYDDVKYIYLVMELCSGGELFDRISDTKRPFTEKEVAQVISKLLKAIIHCQALNISHRDIKPENIMYGADGEVKLIDFGLAKQSEKKGQVMHTIAGTPYFIAPEVLKGEYDQQCDIWSLGVVFYMTLSGKYPFDGNGRTEVFAKIQSGKFEFPAKQFSNVSDECKNLITQMLQVDRKKRLTADQCLKHIWFQKMQQTKESSTAILNEEIINRLKAFKGTSKLKKTALNVLVKMLKSKDIEKLREVFQQIDTDNSGFIEISELENAIKSAKQEMSTKEMKQIINELDYQGNHRINYTEFLAATISIQSILTHERLYALFKQFDVDNNEEITSANIRVAMSKLGKNVTEEELDEIMRKHDVSGDKAISFDEFKTMMMEVQE